MITSSHPRRLVLVALGTLITALSPTGAAQAQSTSIVQIKKVDGASSQAVGLLADFSAVVQQDNDANFRQHWSRRTVAPNTFTFQSRLFSQDGCLKVRETTPASDLDRVVLGSCSSARAKWRREFLAGPGDHFVNVGTGHDLSGPINIGPGPLDVRIGVFPGGFAAQAASLVRFDLDFL